jgi:hypothetical protein
MIAAFPLRIDAIKDDKGNKKQSQRVRAARPAPAPLSKQQVSSNIRHADEARRRQREAEGQLTEACRLNKSNV